MLPADSLHAQDSMFVNKVTAQSKTIAKHFFLHSIQKPVAYPQQSRELHSKDYLFYLISFLLAVVALFRLFNNKYYTNMIRVFFNSSLRQSQLVDQLVQDKQASLVLNLFFVTTMGLYLFLLLNFFKIAAIDDLFILGICLLLVLAVYLMKYIITFFFGWITGYLPEAENYIFIVFLLNKVMAIVLLPIIILMAYVEQAVVSWTINLSLFLIGFIFFLRYFRAYGLLQYKMKVSRLHFMVYIIGVEILPILIIYKSALNILSKNL